MLPQIQITGAQQTTGTHWLVIPAPSWYLQRHPNRNIVGVWQVKDPVTSRRYLVVRRQPVVGNGNGGHEWDCDCPNGIYAADAGDDGLCEHVAAVQVYCASRNKPA
jgi:hypothetical protein